MQSLDFHTKIVGVTFRNTDGTERQELIEELRDQLGRSGLAPLTLQRDRRNPHDANAVAVLDTTGRQLGFLPAKVSAQIAPLMDRGIAPHAEVACITGEGMTQNYGVNVHIWTTTE